MKDYEFRLFTWGGSDVYVARNSCLRYPGAKDPRGVKVLPWNGDLEYDRILWIDTDTVFTVEDVKRLLSHSEDIVSGCVKVDLKNFGVQRVLETPYGGHAFATIMDVVQNPATGEYVDAFKLWRKECEQPNGLCKVDACGGAFLSVKRGVYEAMGYPWYTTGITDVDGLAVEMSEDIAWCARARAFGFEIWADPEVRPGHEKALVLK
jgi:hypothetical protein